MINAFPGYTYENGKNMYRGVDVGKGGYVYAEPGMYRNVALLDVQSMHPNSIVNLNAFGEYTQHFKDMLDARIAIKHGDFEATKNMLGGRLTPYLTDESKAKDLSNALKTALNSCYGLTAANFDHPMRDKRNKNNIVALRGALFMKTLQDEVQSRGFTVVHIKTDSIKVADATQEIVDFVMDFGKQYGYTFEWEATYDRICLVNDAVYIARYSKDEKINGKHAGKWTATGAQFQVPYVFKKLFTKEPIEFDDLCETKEVKNSAIYLDMNEELPEGEHNYHFVGRVGSFCPIKPGCGGADLVREAKDKNGNVKYDSVTGAKDYRWLESEMVKELGKKDDIDISYYNKLVDEAIHGKGKGKDRKPGIADFGDFEWFVSDDPEPNVAPWFKADIFDDLPWKAACGKDSCEGCPHLHSDMFHYDCRLGHDVSDLNVTIDLNDDFKKR